MNGEALDDPSSDDLAMLLAYAGAVDDGDGDVDCRDID